MGKIIAFQFKNNEWYYLQKRDEIIETDKNYQVEKLHLRFGQCGVTTELLVLPKPDIKSIIISYEN